eukprot:819410-Prymnesium_polylepis.1
MASEGLGTAHGYALCEGCSFECSELMAAWRSPASMRPTGLRSSVLLTQSTPSPRIQVRESRWPTASR